MTRGDAASIAQMLKDVLSEIDEHDPDETEIWTEIHWDIKDLIEKIEDYYK